MHETPVGHSHQSEDEWGRRMHSDFASGVSFSGDAADEKSMQPKARLTVEKSFTRHGAFTRAIRSAVLARLVSVVHFALIHSSRATLSAAAPAQYVVPGAASSRLGRQVTWLCDIALDLAGTLASCRVQIGV